ncbi:MAG TPA: reverse transcriptase family protein [Gemmataceae bacterium]|nr:reverse transcriptase family protein [Gemmataceae bacterium]
MDSLDHVPAWLLRPLPVNTVIDEKLNARIDKLGSKLPGSLKELQQVLDAVKAFREYDSAVNRACAHIWAVIDQFYAAEDKSRRLALLVFARQHMTEEAQARICRRLVKDRVLTVRSKARAFVRQANLREVALPLKPGAAWDPTGWTRGTVSGPLSRHAQGRRILEKYDLPALANLGKLRELLDIRSERQLGFFLLASDHDNGPYTTFTIPKRDGSDREICAPKGQLRWVQRQILEKILNKVPAHDAAHGFIAGRSTVTNAAKHLGAAILLKFDLSDFFPTIHYFRVVGLFASLGYFVGDARFHAKDDSKQVAPTLARLCCYTPDARLWGAATLPQGAPTSPSISNLVCRRLDARLEGLAQRNQGVYTRYADDLTFSFKHTDTDLGRFRWWVDQICHQEGFFVNQRKFRVIRGSQRQVVTGIVVNDELRIPRDERRRFRAILNNCRKHGVESQARKHPRFTEYLRGFASYVNMVHPEEGAELRRQLDELLGPETEE